MATVQEQVAESLEASCLRGSSLVVAVSGGSDSLTLLHCLRSLQTSMNLRLHVVHVDHGLRPTSYYDAAFVQKLAVALEVPCTVVSVSIGNGSPEAAARDARYGALAKVAADQDAAVIAVGHTLNDQAETVLLHIVRGSGLTGLRAMSVFGDLSIDNGQGIKIFRPLLGVSRSETDAFCDELGLAPIQDHTNLDTTIPRNLLRIKAIPLLETLNPKLVEGLRRLTDTVRIDLDYIDSRLDEVWPDLVEQSGQIATLKRDLFNALHPSLQRHALRMVYEGILGSAAGLEYVHLENMLMLAQGAAGKVLTLPGGVCMEARHESILLFPPGADRCELPILVDRQELRVPGETMFGRWCAFAEVVPRPQELDAGTHTSYFDATALAGALSVRGWHNGDRFQPLGLARGNKKLQNFFVDAHVPQSYRRRVPLMVAPQGIAWVVGYRIAHWARVTPKTQAVLKVKFKLLEEVI